MSTTGATSTTGADAAASGGATGGAGDDAPGRGAWFAAAFGLAAWGGLATLVALRPEALPFSMVPPVRHAVAFVLATRGLWRVARLALPGPWGPAGASVTRAAGWAVAAHAVLTHVVRGGFQPLALPLAGLITGVVVYRQHQRFPAEAGARARPAVALTGLALSAASGVAALAALGDGMPYRGQVAFLLYLTVAVLALTQVAQHLSRSPNRRVAAAAHVFAASPRRNLGLVLTVAAYLTFRPALQGSVRHLTVYEWGVGLTIAGYLLNRLTAWFKRDAAEAPWTSDRRRHEQQVRALPDERVQQLDAAMRGFLQGREPPAAYAAAWHRATAGSTVGGDALERAVAEVAEHEDAPEPRVLRVPWRVRRVREENMERRRALHERVMMTIQETG